MEKIEIRVLPETELIGVIAVLSGSVYFKERNNGKYRQDIFSYFKDFLGSEVIKMFQLLEKDYLFNYDRPIELVLDQKDDGKLSQTMLSYVNKGAKQMYDKFYRLLCEFKEKSKFDEFYKAHSGQYEEAVTHFKERVPQERCCQFLLDCTKEKLSKKLIINLMFAVTSSNYGWQTKEFCYCNIRPYKFSYKKDFPDFAYDNIYVETLVVHEFGHSIINPITDKFSQKIEALDEGKFEKCFKNNPYGSDKKTAINETIIRAIECLYVEKYFSKIESEKLADDYIEDGFLHIKKVMKVMSNKNLPLHEYYDEILECFT